jgi:hypothetical protein
MYVVIGDIFPDDSADDGRGRSKKEKKDKGFIVFALFAYPGFHLGITAFMWPGITLWVLAPLFGA